MNGERLGQNREELEEEALDARDAKMGATALKLNKNEQIRRGLTVRETVRNVREEIAEREPDFTILRPAREKVCDRNHLVDQRIIVTDAEDLDRTDFRFKLAEREFGRLVEYFGKNGTTASGAEVTNGKMIFESTKPKDDDPEGILEDFKVCDAYVFERENEVGEKMKVFVAEPRKDRNASINSFSTNVVRAAIGLVKIEAPREMSPKATEDLLDQIMTEDFGIPDALENVTVEDENDYKLVEFAKRIGKSPNKLSDAERARALKMERVEIYPGYTDLMDEGRHFEIENEFGKIYVVHTMHRGDVDSVERLLKQGLLCSTERYARGVTVSGLSSFADFHSGGADFVFARAMTEERIETLEPGTVVVFKDKLLDWMMTWYEDDQFGATDAETRKGLMSTEQLLKFINEKVEGGGDYPRHNEGMVPLGIGAELIDQVLVDTERQRKEMIEELKKRGMNEFDGRAIEEVIMRRPSVDEPGDEVAEELEDEEADEVLAQADKEVEEMLKAGVFPQNDEFFGDDWDDDWDDDFGMVKAWHGGVDLEYKSFDEEDFGDEPLGEDVWPDDY